MILKKVFYVWAVRPVTRDHMVGEVMSAHESAEAADKEANRLRRMQQNPDATTRFNVVEAYANGETQDGSL